MKERKRKGLDCDRDGKKIVCERERERERERKKRNEKREKIER